MDSSDPSSGISFKDAIGIFWDWRQASIPLELCFLSCGNSPAGVRVSIDGLVTLVDPEGTVTISGDGREIELDLRGSQFQWARQAQGTSEGFNPLDPDAILQIRLPNEQICLVFPYRRVGGVLLGQRYPATGVDWLREKLGPPVPRRRSTDSPFRPRRGQALDAVGAIQNPEQKPGTNRRGLAIFLIVAIVAALVFCILALAPAKLLHRAGINLTPQSLKDPDVRVWVIGSEGNYYCPGTVLAGRQPGGITNNT